MLSEYARRREVETLFSCLKVRGFDLETTHMTQDERLGKLLALLSITLVWCYRVGEWQIAQKPVRLLKQGSPAKTIFRVGKDFLQHISMRQVIPPPLWEHLRLLLGPSAIVISDFYVL